MTYRLSRHAEQDLLYIHAAGVEAFGVEQAERYLDGLEAAFDLIARFPQIVRERHELNPPVRIYPCRSHVIVYLIDERGVSVMRVRHGREDWLADATE